MASDMFKHSRLPVTDQQISQASSLTDSSVKPIMTSNGNNTIQQTSAAEATPTMTQTLSTGQKKRVGVFHVFFVSLVLVAVFSSYFRLLEFIFNSSILLSKFLVVCLSARCFCWPVFVGVFVTSWYCI